MTREDTRRHDKAREGTASHEKARQGTRRHGHESTGHEGTECFLLVFWIPWRSALNDSQSSFLQRFTKCLTSSVTI